MFVKIAEKPLETITQNLMHIMMIMLWFIVDVQIAIMFKH